MQDLRGNPVSTGSNAAIDAAERALWRLMTFYGTPLDDLDAAIAADPGWVLPPLMKAGFLLGLSEARFSREGSAVLEAAEPLLASANPRERAHHHALRTLQAGDWHGACREWEALLLAHPRDGLALQWAHLHDFYRGDALNLRQRIVRVLPEWDEADPLHPHVLAMLAFGLEESNLYVEAEEAGRRALAADPKAPWAVHAVAHVMEMQGRHQEGTQWMERWRPEWSAGNGFSVHLGWHQALFALERLDVDTVLALVDEHMAAAKTSVALEWVDTASLLWRLHLLQVDVGTRWHELLAVWNPSPDAAGHYAFNDLHALLVLIGAGEWTRADEWLQATTARAEAADPSIWVTRWRPKIDRIACPWFITRFVDPFARIYYVEPAQVLACALEIEVVLRGLVPGQRRDPVEVRADDAVFRRRRRQLLEPGELPVDGLSDLLR